MATYISLVQFTDKGIQAAKETTQRVADWASKVESSGASKTQTWSYWPSVQYICLMPTPIDSTLEAQSATRWVVSFAAWIPLSVNCTKLMYVAILLFLSVFSEFVSIRLR